MKAIALHALGGVAARNRQQRRLHRHAAMKCRVEARHLGHIRIAALHRFDEFDFARQMLGIERGDSPQLRQQRRRHPLRLAVLHAMHHSMTDGIRSARIGDLRLELLRQTIRGRRGGFTADPLHFPIQQSAPAAHRSKTTAKRTLEEPALMVRI